MTRLVPVASRKIPFSKYLFGPRAAVSVAAWPYNPLASSHVSFDSRCRAGYHLSCPSHGVGGGRDFAEVLGATSAASLAKAYDDIAKPIPDKVHVLMQQNQRLQEARDLLLPRLMSGEISV